MVSIWVCLLGASLCASAASHRRIFTPSDHFSESAETIGVVPGTDFFNFHTEIFTAQFTKHHTVNFRLKRLAALMHRVENWFVNSKDPFEARPSTKAFKSGPFLFNKYMQWLEHEIKQTQGTDGEEFELQLNALKSLHDMILGATHKMIHQPKRYKPPGPKNVLLRIEHAWYHELSADTPVPPHSHDAVLAGMYFIDDGKYGKLIGEDEEDLAEWLDGEWDSKENWGGNPDMEQDPHACSETDIDVLLPPNKRKKKTKPKHTKQAAPSLSKLSAEELLKVPEHVKPKRARTTVSGRRTSRYLPRNRTHLAGCTMIVDPRGSHLTQNLDQEFDFGTEVCIKAQPGTLVLMPSWLQHHVIPHQGPGKRLVIAFTVHMEMKQVDNVGQTTFWSKSRGGFAGGQKGMLLPWKKIMRRELLVNAAIDRLWSTHIVGYDFRSQANWLKQVAHKLGSPMTNKRFRSAITCSVHSYLCSLGNHVQLSFKSNRLVATSFEDAAGHLHDPLGNGLYSEPCPESCSELHTSARFDVDVVGGRWENQDILRQESLFGASHEPITKRADLMGVLFATPGWSQGVNVYDTRRSASNMVAGFLEHMNKDSNIMRGNTNEMLCITPSFADVGINPPDDTNARVYLMEIFVRPREKQPTDQV
mmetsp:Transcript_24874/g.48946  ORF Transcript_24874/g.48946 Transcript_24874/m.48946 type:complete len:645 (-) Transcript_24874:104-2038(-)